MMASGWRTFRFTFTCGLLLFLWLLAVPVSGQQTPGAFTITWQNFATQLGVAPTGPTISTVEGGSSTLPDFESLLKKYYLDHSEAGLTEIKRISSSNNFQA